MIKITTETGYFYYKNVTTLLLQTKKVTIITEKNNDITSNALR